MSKPTPILEGDAADDALDRLERFERWRWDATCKALNDCWRYRIERARGEGNVLLAEERCTSRNDTAEVLETNGTMILNREDVEWLHKTLDELLAKWEPSLRARAEAIDVRRQMASAEILLEHLRQELDAARAESQRLMLAAEKRAERYRKALEQAEDWLSGLSPGQGQGLVLALARAALADGEEWR